MVILDFPSIVKKYSPIFEKCFSAEGYAHFKKAVSGFLISENKTVEAINRQFINSACNQSSFNRFFNQQAFDLEQLNEARLEMLHKQEQTQFKFSQGRSGVLSIDSSLLTHYGKHFDNIYYHYDYVHKSYRWAHDLVSLYYSDDQTDYPVYWRLWEPPDWEAVATFLMGKGYHINPQKWDNRKAEPQKWRNYIRARYKTGRKAHPEVIEVYKTKLHLAQDLLEKFCKQYPQCKFPIVLDSGFTSAQLCQVITKQLQRNYVGALREDQYIYDKQGQLIVLKDFIAQLRSQQADPAQKSLVQKTTYPYKGQKKTAYAYVASHHVKGFKQQQRLVISFLKQDLTDRPQIAISNRRDWYASGILRIRRHRWPVETYHQEGKAEGLDKYQLRNHKAIQTHIALVVIAFSMLKCAMHDADLLSSLQQQLQVESKLTLPLLRRLLKVEGLLLLVDHVFTMIHQGHALDQVLQPLIQSIAYN